MKRETRGMRLVSVLRYVISVENNSPKYYARTLRAGSATVM